MKNRTLVNHKKLSLAARVITVVLVLTSTAITGAVSLQYIYQGEVDRYFEKEQGSELMLIIQTGHHTLRTTGSGKENFRPLLGSQLGDYQGHRFVGWHADFSKMSWGSEFPFFMLYEVNYQNGSTQEFFSYEGLLNPELVAREIRLN
ncbi:hypothetical protein [Endozoicomonas arenosclerae]|uniref:hypothetical protein n=1 Tax=Endozoicomonas arenosclerae TaxID=1633495 RepID=UPI0007823ECA|nr:hypothetical protein [Endozoicomonas arenosclerae]